MTGPMDRRQQSAEDHDREFTQHMREFIQDRRIRERMVAERFMESVIRSEPLARG